MKIFYDIGKYSLFLKSVFAKPDKFSVFFGELIKEIYKLGILSIGIVMIITFFMGAVITLQSAYNLENPLIPLYVIGYGARDTIILEFSNTIVCLILAGKVGSNIASEIGTMRVSEQIDALDIMGVNSANHLVLPKILGAMFFFPFLNIIAITVGILGGYLACVVTNALPPDQFAYGLHAYFIPYYIYYSLTKMTIFAFILTSIPAYYGYYVKGGSLEVGRASTQAVVYSSIMILVANTILTQLMLAK